VAANSKKAKKSEIKHLIQAIYESMYLRRIQRSGSSLILGDSVKENVAEHAFYTSLLALVYSYLDPDVDFQKLLTMCLIHDLEDVRTGDINQINKLYYSNNPEFDAFRDIWDGSDFGEQLSKIHDERHSKKSREAIASSDCDVLAEILIEKEYILNGINAAEEWTKFQEKRIKTDVGKKICESMMSMDMDEWWKKMRNEIRQKHKQKKVRYD
jgi:putative hydrolase of HD superfamily